MPWAAITAIGTVLAGLALPLAFVQLGALRQDRLRAQVSKVGIWLGDIPPLEPDTQAWNITILIRNSSELPVIVQTADLLRFDRAHPALNMRYPADPIQPVTGYGAR